MLTLNTEVSNDLLKKAIELRINDCFGALNMANSLGGVSTTEWELVRQHGLDALVEEALDRLMPVGDFKASVDGKRFTECKVYLRLRGIIGGRSDFPS